MGQALPSERARRVVRPCACLLACAVTGILGYVALRVRDAAVALGRCTDLIAAAGSCDTDEVVRLVRAGVDPDCRDDLTPLTAAAHNGCTRTVQALLALGASPLRTNSVSNPGQNALMASSDRDVTALLLADGVPVNAQDALGRTALSYAAEGGNADVAAVLLAGGADADAEDASGATPLLRAAERAHVEVVRLLLGAGADPLRRDRAGRTPTSIALKLMVSYTVTSYRDRYRAIANACQGRRPNVASPAQRR